jgi:cobalt-zinc-cadmium resistance protein CzcA
MEDGSIVDNDDVISARRADAQGRGLGAHAGSHHAKVDELNNGILPPGVKVVPMIDRSDLLHFTLHTVMHNLGEGMILVTIILFLFLSTSAPP